MWLSLAGALLCVAVMVLISWWTAVITLAIVLSLYLIVAHRKPGENQSNPFFFFSFFPFITGKNYYYYYFFA